MSTYLITGVAGFIGSHLAQALVERGHRVRGFDNFSTGRRENFAAVAEKLEFVSGDLTDADTVARMCQGCDAILHQGALPSVPRSIKDPRTSHRSNVDGTFNLLEGARAAGVKRVLYAASSSAYGNQPGFPRVETMTPQPVAPYPVQKLAGEYYMQSYWRVYGIETVSLRYFNIFGPRQAPDSPYSGVIAKWVRQMLRNDPDDPPVLQGDGKQARDFTYVENAVQANLLALDAPADAVAGQVFNIACGEKYSLAQVYATLVKLTCYKGEQRKADARLGDIRVSHASIAAAQAAFGYAPTVKLEEGLRRTVEWARTHTAAL